MREKQTIMNPWQWEAKIKLVFSNGHHSGTLVISPFKTYNKTLAWRKKFMDVLVERCSKMGVMCVMKGEDFEFVDSGIECGELLSDPSVEAIEYLSSALREWIGLVNVDTQDKIVANQQGGRLV